MVIEAIHESVLNHLLKNEQVNFSLRSKDKKNEDKLSKGYWFLGNENYLAISFWNSRDWRNKTPNIFFGIDSAGWTWLEFIDKDGGDKTLFFEEIAPIMGLKRIINKRKEGISFLWQKSYANIGNNYLEYLDEFLKKDKPIIDAFIQTKGKFDLFPRIAKESFKGSLDNILSWRLKLNTPKIISVTQTYPLRLRNLILENIGHFKYVNLNLDHQIICLIGENGSGKSSILRSIALGLAGINENDVIDPSIGAVQKMLSISRIVDGNREVFQPKGQINVTYNGMAEKNIINFTHQRGESVDSMGNIVSDFNRVEDDPSSDLTASNGNYFVNLVIGFSQMKSLAEDKNGLNGDMDINPRISEVRPLIYNEPDKAFNHFTSWIIKLWGAKTNTDNRELKLQLLGDIFSVIHKISRFAQLSSALIHMCHRLFCE